MLIPKNDAVAYFWRGKHIKKRLLLVYERDVFMLEF